jgi:SAM-dependent methyltransferase
VPEQFDKDYWESHWQQARRDTSEREVAPNPYLAREISGLVPGTALDAGCGEGAEAIWLAAKGWHVTAADISAEAIGRATDRAARNGASPERLVWIEADLSTWDPGKQFDLVTTHYAHPAMAQLEFYNLIADWVGPRGTLLIVGHLHAPHTHGHEEHGHGHSHERHRHPPPEEVSVNAASITASLGDGQWDVVTADETTRTLTNRDGQTVELHDVVVRATRRL